MTCPTESELLMYSKSTNPVMNFPKIFRHLGSCGQCTEKYIALKVPPEPQEDIPPKPSIEAERTVVQMRSWLNDQVLLDPITIRTCTFDPPLELHLGQRLTVTFTLEAYDENARTG